MGVIKTSIKNRDTYIYIDVSNIRAACYKTLGFRIDFAKLIDYFHAKYPNLQEVRYYEGIALGDAKKYKMFDFLGRRGYTICPLERKAYNCIETEEKELHCPKCAYQWTAKFAREHRVLKSNVDVYLASDMVAQASRADHPIRIILLSCDGDYAEAIKTIIELNEYVSVAVLAAPQVKDIRKNTLSVRLQKLRNELDSSKYMLHNIGDLRRFIESDKNPETSPKCR